jgi:RNA polymerase sigma factor (sigma-70 family)
MLLRLDLARVDLRYCSSLVRTFRARIQVSENMQPPGKDDFAASSSSPHWFVTTHWSVVLEAGEPASPGAAQALEKLCRSYWFPLYTYVRRQGYGSHDAQDLTQGFFARLLRTNSLAAVSPEKGKFRTFLLAALRHFLSDERDRNRAEKRGGGQVIISIDEANAEERYQQMPTVDPDPEKCFDRHWALTVLEQANCRLREEYLASGRQEIFKALKVFLSREASPGDYDRIAAGLHMSPNTVGVAVHRLRQRYRECIRLELAQTVANARDLDQEMNYLFSVLSAEVET